MANDKVPCLSGVCNTVLLQRLALPTDWVWNVWPGLTEGLRPCHDRTTGRYIPLSKGTQHLPRQLPLYMGYVFNKKTNKEKVYKYISSCTDHFSPALRLCGRKSISDLYRSSFDLPLHPSTGALSIMFVIFSQYKAINDFWRINIIPNHLA